MRISLMPEKSEAPKPGQDFHKRVTDLADCASGTVWVIIAIAFVGGLVALQVLFFGKSRSRQSISAQNRRRLEASRGEGNHPQSGNDEGYFTGSPQGRFIENGHITDTPSSGRSPVQSKGQRLGSGTPPIEGVHKEMPSGFFSRYETSMETTDDEREQRMGLISPSLKNHMSPKPTRQHIIQQGSDSDESDGGIGELSEESYPRSIHVTRASRY